MKLPLTLCSFMEFDLLRPLAWAQGYGVKVNNNKCTASSHDTILPLEPIVYYYLDNAAWTAWMIPWI